MYTIDKNKKKKKYERKWSENDRMQKSSIYICSIKRDFFDRF